MALGEFGGGRSLASPDCGAWGRRQGHTFQVGQRCEISIKAEPKSLEGEPSTDLGDPTGATVPHGWAGSDWLRWEVWGAGGVGRGGRA